MREFQKKNTLSDKEIIDYHNEGLYDKEIAEISGCSRTYITQKLNSFGYCDRRIKINDVKLRNRISETLLNKDGKIDNKILYKNVSKQGRLLFDAISLLYKAKKDYTCEICGKKGGKLNVHHKRYFNIIVRGFIEEFYDKLSKKSIACQLMEYEDFISESNLQLLCVNCHYKQHEIK